MSKLIYLNSELIDNFDQKQFHCRQPYPWASLHQCLTPIGFEQLYRDFPQLEIFEKHENLPRTYNQRPHNRYYLSLDRRRHNGNENKAGVIKRSQLSASWQRFIDELESDSYQKFLFKVMGTGNFELQYSWHIGVTDSEVSPHCDWKRKAGNHIFYFNTSDEWQQDWGGAPVVLGNKRAAVMNPDFQDFDIKIAVPYLDNSSFLFQNITNAWHGVEALKCPANKYRRLFNVTPTIRTLTGTIFSGAKSIIDRIKKN